MLPGSADSLACILGISINEVKNLAVGCFSLRTLWPRNRSGRVKCIVSEIVYTKIAQSTPKLQEGHRELPPLITSGVPQSLEINT